MKSTSCRLYVSSCILAIVSAIPLASFAAAPEPCELLTLADVRAALGAQWTHNAKFSEGEVCAYQAAAVAAVSILLTSDAAGAASILAGRRQLAGSKATAAPGPGDGAYFVDTPWAIAIVFGNGDWVAQIEATPAATRDRAVLEKLAQAAYGRLP